MSWSICNKNSIVLIVDVFDMGLFPVGPRSVYSVVAGSGSRHGLTIAYTTLGDTLVQMSRSICNVINSIQFNFILRTNRQTAVTITNRANMYVMQSVTMDKNLI